MDEKKPMSLKTFISKPQISLPSLVCVTKSAYKHIKTGDVLHLTRTLRQYVVEYVDTWIEQMPISVPEDLGGFIIVYTSFNDIAYHYPCYVRSLDDLHIQDTLVQSGDKLRLKAVYRLDNKNYSICIHIKTGKELKVPFDVKGRFQSNVYTVKELRYRMPVTVQRDPNIAEEMKKRHKRYFPDLPMDTPMILMKALTVNVDHLHQPDILDICTLNGGSKKILSINTKIEIQEFNNYLDYLGPLQQLSNVPLGSVCVAYGDDDIFYDGLPPKLSAVINDGTKVKRGVILRGREYFFLVNKDYWKNMKFGMLRNKYKTRYHRLERSLELIPDEDGNTRQMDKANVALHDYSESLTVTKECEYIATDVTTLHINLTGQISRKQTFQIPDFVKYNLQIPKEPQGSKYNSEALGVAEKSAESYMWRLSPREYKVLVGEQMPDLYQRGYTWSPWYLQVPTILLKPTIKASPKPKPQIQHSEDKDFIDAKAVAAATTDKAAVAAADDDDPVAAADDDNDDSPNIGNLASSAHLQSHRFTKSRGEITLSLCESDISLKIPKNATQQTGDISLSISKSNQHPPPLQEDQYLIGPVLSCQPNGIIFCKPVTISVPHSFVNLTPKYLQIWSKSESTEASYDWQMIYDGMQDQTALDGTVINIIIEGSKIKFRVTHFTLFATVLAPISKLMNWIYPEVELTLDIWAYLSPINVTDKVVLRIYALQDTDKEGKHLVQTTELGHKGGRCAFPTNFTLTVNKKNLNIQVHDLYPRATWVSGNMNPSIPFRNIMLGGLGARCDIQFQLAEDVVEHPNRFSGAFDLAQEGNEFCINGIYFDNDNARISLEIQQKDLLQPQNLPVQNIQREMRNMEMQRDAQVPPQQQRLQDKVLVGLNAQQKDDFHDDEIKPLKCEAFASSEARLKQKPAYQIGKPIVVKRRPLPFDIQQDDNPQILQRDPLLTGARPKQKSVNPSRYCKTSQGADYGLHHAPSQGGEFSLQQTTYQDRESSLHQTSQGRLPSLHNTTYQGGVSSLHHSTSQGRRSDIHDDYSILKSVATLPGERSKNYQGDPKLPFGGATSGLYSLSQTEQSMTPQPSEDANNFTSQENTTQPQGSKIGSPCSKQNESSTTSMASAIQTKHQHSSPDVTVPGLRQTNHQPASLSIIAGCHVQQQSTESQSPRYRKRKPTCGNWNQVFQKIARNMATHEDDLQNFAMALNLTVSEYKEIQRKNPSGAYFVAFAMLNRWLDTIDSSKRPQEVKEMLVEAIRSVNESLANEVKNIY